jgi:hypothetical protein
VSVAVTVLDGASVLSSANTAVDTIESDDAMARGNKDFFIN